MEKIWQFLLKKQKQKKRAREFWKEKLGIISAREQFEYLVKKGLSLPVHTL